jgi:hypothetical protein
MLPSYYTDPQDRHIGVFPFEDRGGQQAFSVEITVEDEVVDHYTLYGVASLDNIVRSRKWSVVKDG